jgi:hypothetical protein
VATTVSELANSAGATVRTTAPTMLTKNGFDALTVRVAADSEDREKKAR